MYMSHSKKILARVLFWIYLFMLVWIILFKMSFSISQIPKIHFVNFIPFHYDEEVVFHWWEVMLNIVIFIPCGIYLKMFNFDHKNTVICGFCFSLLLETLQLVLKIGVFDVTDLITNTLGTILGMLGYVSILKLFRNKKKLDFILTIVALAVTITMLLLVVAYVLG